MALQTRNKGTSERAPMMEFKLSDHEFKFLSDLFYDKTGIVLGDAKRDMVYSRLTRRIRTLGLSGFSDYCDLLQGPQSDSELNHAINAITTNLTKFFRESHHFDFIRDTVVPKLFSGPATRSRRIRFWSAGCSSGMEPYSLAMTLLEAVPAISKWDCKILATDIDDNMLAIGSAGYYTNEQTAGLQQSLKQKYMSKEQDGYRFKPQVKELIAFKKLNLLHRWPMKGPFDIIFCRNVVIYFDSQTQRTLFSKMADLMTDESRLLIGHAENLRSAADLFELVGQTIYRKREASR